MDFLKKNKKDDDLPILSESGIHKKLYGEFDNKDRTVEDEVHQLDSEELLELELDSDSEEEEPESTQSDLFDGGTEEAEEDGEEESLEEDEEDLDEENVLGKDEDEEESEKEDDEEEEEISDDSLEKEDIVDENEEENEGEEEEETPEKSLEESEDTADENEEKSDLFQAAESSSEDMEETKAKYISLSEFESKDEKEHSEAVINKISKANIFVRGINALLKGIWTAVKVSFRIIGKCLYFLLGLVDPKRPQARRFFYWAAGIAVVVLLFFGVNALNLQRESAIKSKVEPRDIRQSLPTIEEEKNVIIEEAILDASMSEPEVIVPVVVDPEKIKQAPRLVAPEGRYVIQVAIYNIETDAKRVTDSLINDGISAFYKGVERTNGRTRYYVYVGRYLNNSEAKKGLVEFQKKESARPFQDAFIKILKQ